MPVKVVVVDDNIDVAEVIATTLQFEGIDVDIVTSSFASLFEPTRWADVQVAIVDFYLGEIRGDTILHYLEEHAPHVRRVLLSAGYVERYGADVVLGKPFRPETLVAACGGPA